MKNVLVLIHDDIGQEARFQAALDVTRALAGHMTCLDVTVTPVLGEDYASIAGYNMLLATEQKTQSRNRERMEARLKVEGISFSWLQMTGTPSVCVREHAGMADLIVLNSRFERCPPFLQEVCEEVLLRTRRPVLAVPRDTSGFQAAGPALIAWDGSREAQAALRAAVPLLLQAQAVHILECDDGSISIPAEEAADYLSRHGIVASIRRTHEPRDVSGQILREVDVVRPSFLVMGGFGHGPLVEALLGGVTRRILGECPASLLLAH